MWLDPRVLVRLGRRERGEAHPKLSAPGTEHTITIEDPPADSPGGQQLTLT
jgi:hypothetical protein